jgi:hypothetical protein
MDSLLEQEFGELGEFEFPANSYFYVDGYQIMPDGSFRLLQSIKPWWTTQDEAGKVATGMCVRWHNNNPTWQIGVRCLRWTGSQWVKCAFWNVTPCQDIS